MTSELNDFNVLKHLIVQCDYHEFTYVIINFLKKKTVSTIDNCVLFRRVLCDINKYIYYGLFYHNQSPLSESRERSHLGG